jgi:hypothetical protein
MFVERLYISLHTKIPIGGGVWRFGIHASVATVALLGGRVGIALHMRIENRLYHTA